MTPLFLNAAIESLVAEIGRHEFKFRVLKRTAKALVSEIGQQNVQIPVYLGVYTHTHTHTHHATPHCQLSIGGTVEQMISRNEVFSSFFWP